MRFWILFCVSFCFSTICMAQAQPCESVQADFLKGTVPSPQDLSGLWHLTMMAGDPDCYLDETGLKQGNNFLWTLEFQGNPLTVTSTHFGFPAQTASIQFTASTASFKLNDPEVGPLAIDCKLFTNQELICREMFTKTWSVLKK